MMAETVIKHLRERADFWAQFPAHASAAKLLVRELDLLDASWVREKLEARDWKHRKQEDAR